jgi:hypothetical protein
MRTTVPRAGEVLHLLGVPVAGVGEHDLRQRVDPRGGKLSLSGADHRLVSEVRRVDRHLGGDHDLLGGDHGLRVVALHPAREVLTLRESGSVTLITPVGVAGGR